MSDNRIRRKMTEAMARAKSRDHGRQNKASRWSREIPESDDDRLVNGALEGNDLRREDLERRPAPSVEFRPEGAPAGRSISTRCRRPRSEKRTNFWFGRDNAPSSARSKLRRADRSGASPAPRPSREALDMLVPRTARAAAASSGVSPSSTPPCGICHSKPATSSMPPRRFLRRPDKDEAVAIEQRPRRRCGDRANRRCSSARPLVRLVQDWLARRAVAAAESGASAISSRFPGSAPSAQHVRC